MKLNILLLGLLMSTPVFAGNARVHDNSRNVRGDIRLMLMELMDIAQSRYSSDETLSTIRTGLDSLLISLDKPKFKLICSKQGNGRFYPTSLESGQIVGSADWSASYSSLEDCRGNLPLPGESVTCFKQYNGRFYVSQATSGAIVGSNDWSASYSVIQDCRRTLPKHGQPVACYKQGNGRFYPSRSETGEIIGSSDWSASYSDLNSCLVVINQ